MPGSTDFSSDGNFEFYGTQLAVEGFEPRVPEENDKPTVIALREISAELVTPATIAAQEEAAKAEQY